MNTTVKSWLLLAVLVGAAVTGFLLAPVEEANALPPFTRLTDYYSDSGLTNYVGFCFRNCAGSSTCDGTQTSYWVREFDYYCIGSSYCCIVCSPGPCPSHILSNYPCPPC